MRVRICAVGKKVLEVIDDGTKRRSETHGYCRFHTLQIAVDEGIATPKEKREFKEICLKRKKLDESVCE